MPTQIQTYPIRSFTGGLNLRANAMQLLQSESPDMQNVDIDPRGGISMRGILNSFQTTALPLPPLSLMQYLNVSGSVKQVVVNVAGSSTTTRMYSSSGGNFSAMTTTAGHVTAGVHRAATMIKTTAAGSNILNLLYITNGTDPVMTYDGATCADLTDAATAFHDDFGAPTFGTCIKGACIAVWQGSLWMANTLENAVAKKSRIRWSHPGNPQDWRTNDYWDVDSHADGDYITAILPIGNRLYIFKNESFHVMTGFGPGNFQVQTISHKVGAPSQEAVCAIDDTLYFYNGPTGPYSYSERGGLDWIGERLYPDITSAFNETAYQANVVCGVVNNRVWFSCTTATSTVNNWTYIYDPTLWYHTSIGKANGRWRQGGWTQYNVGFNGIMTWAPPGSAPTFMGIAPSELWTLKLDQTGDQDSWGYDYLNITGANTTNAPDSAATSITGSIDISARVALTDWTPAAVNALIGKWTSAVDQRAYELSVLTTGELRFRWSTDGTAPNIKQAASVVAVPATDGAAYWVRATLDVATGNVVFYYSSATDYGTWTTLATVAGAGATTMVNTTAVVTIGQIDAGTTPMVGKFYEGRIYSGITTAQTLVANPSVRNSQKVTTIAIVDTAGPNTFTLAGAGQALVTAYARDIVSFYVSQWYDLDNPIMQKRWRRPEFIHSSAVNSTMTIDTFADYDPTMVSKTFHVISNRAVTGSSLWGTAWATMVWGASGTDNAIMITKGPNLGRGKSVAFKISGQTGPSARWVVNGYTLKYIPMRIRT